MPDNLNIADFLEPVSISMISNDESYHDGQIGNSISVYDEEFPDIAGADLVFVGCNEYRGAGPVPKSGSGDPLRHEFYRLYNWHTSLQLADIGNIRDGARLSDTYAALKTVVKEIVTRGKTVIILGGAHDLTLAQYYAYTDMKRLIEATCVDARIDINMQSPAAADHFLMEMLTADPNFMKHFNHIGFQSYLVHPLMLETLDKLRFDCFRLGKAREDMEEMEPVVRESDLFSFDLSAIAAAYAPINDLPNGFTGDEACALMRYAGMSPITSSVGIYGYSASADREGLTAKQVAQMLWYFLEGRNRGTREARISDKDSFNEFHIAFAEVSTTFLQSKRTGRWWMQLPDMQFIACSYADYMLASTNQIPERWLRAQERSA